jgi:hypothetical protein
MIKLINLLTESYSFTGPKKTSDGVRYNFINKKGNNIFVSIDNSYEDYWISLVNSKAKPEDITNDNLILDVSFGLNKGNPWAQTESGDGIAVLNTVADILKKFIAIDFKGYGEFTLECHPANEADEETSRNSKRDRIYQNLAEKMMKQLPYVTKVESLGGSWGDDEYKLYILINKNI